MRITYDQNFQRVLEITEKELQELERIKKEWIHSLSEYAENVREELDLELSLHLRNEGKISELVNLRHHIIHDLDYNKDSQKVISLTNGSIQFPDEQEFIMMANAYNILDNITRADRVLKNHVRVKVIEWLIQHQYQESEDTGVKIIKSRKKEGREIEASIKPFRQEGYAFFWHCMENPKHKKRIFISMLYAFLDVNRLFEGNQNDYATYYNKYVGEPIIKFYKRSVNLAPRDFKSKYYRSIEEEYKRFIATNSSK